MFWGEARGVLSPILFAVYINDLINKLRNSGRGCRIDGVFLGCIVYADDILLISNSFEDMQCMLDICFKEAECLGMSFNVKKSFYIRCGVRAKVVCTALRLGSDVINNVDCIRYLGVVFKAGFSLKCDFSQVKGFFYRAFNAIYSKCSNSDNELSAVFLLKSFCLPILSYALESLILNRGAFKLLQSVVDNAVRKIFKVLSTDSIREIRSNVG